MPAHKLIMEMCIMIFNKLEINPKEMATLKNNGNDRKKNRKLIVLYQTLKTQASKFFDGITLSR